MSNKYNKITMKLWNCLLVKFVSQIILNGVI